MNERDNGNSIIENTVDDEKWFAPFTPEQCESLRAFWKKDSSTTQQVWLGSTGGEHRFAMRRPRFESGGVITIRERYMNLPIDSIEWRVLTCYSGATWRWACLNVETPEQARERIRRKQVEYLIATS